MVLVLEDVEVNDGELAEAIFTRFQTVKFDPKKFSSSRFDHLNRDRDGHDSPIELFNGPSEHRDKGLKLE